MHDSEQHFNPIDTILLSNGKRLFCVAPCQMYTKLNLFSLQSVALHVEWYAS